MNGEDGFDELVAQERAAYLAGRRARFEGKPAFANPHPHDSELWPEWDAGWEDADYGMPADPPTRDAVWR